MRLTTVFAVISLSSLSLLGCGSTANPASSDGGDFSGDMATSMMGGDNSATGTDGKGGTITFSGAAAASSSYNTSTADLVVLLTEGTVPQEVMAGKHVLTIFLHQEGTGTVMPFTTGTYDVVLKQGNPLLFGGANLSVFDSNCVTAGGQTIKNSGENAGTIVITELSATKVVGTLDTKAGNTGEQRITAHFSAPIVSTGREVSPTCKK